MHYSKEEKAMWLEDWQQSGKSAYHYAKENGFTPWTFIRWTKEKVETEQGFVEVPEQTKSNLHNEPEILIEKGWIKIHIPLCLGSKELRVVMEGLGVGL